MSLRKSTCCSTALAALLVTAAAGAQSSDALSLDEVKTAASAKFERLDKDGDAKLEPAELSGLLGDKAFKLADPDADGSLDKNEYLALVEKLFKRADVDRDGTVDVKELNGPNGKMLKRLIR
jgi:hypothetical protein